MDRFQELQTFVRVVEDGSITAAAERLETAKSVVSRRLSALEERLGVQLFRRTTRRLSLTDSGRAYYERAARILADLGEAEAAVSRAHGALQGRLRVAAPLSFGLLHLAPALDALKRRHPALDFDLDLNDRQVDLLQEGFDVAVRIARLEDSSLVARRLAPVHRLACASPAYLEAHGRPETPGDLARHECLDYGYAPEPGVWSYRAPDGRPGRVQVPVRVRANNGELLRALAEAGHGVVLQPTFILHEALRAGRLVPLLTDHVWPSLDAWAVYPRTRHLSRRVRAFVDFLADRWAGTPSWDDGLPLAATGSR